MYHPDAAKVSQECMKKKQGGNPVSIAGCPTNPASCFLQVKWPGAMPRTPILETGSAERVCEMISYDHRNRYQPMFDFGHSRVKSSVCFVSWPVLHAKLTHGAPDRTKLNAKFQNDI